MDIPSKFAALYKENGIHGSQQENRRKEILKRQKELRLKLQDDCRTGLKDFILKIRRKLHKSYQEKYHSNERLQFSEWLHERPEDLDRWFLVPCPKGERCIVIASEGRTEMYNKNGRFILSFHSSLPGSIKHANNYTILDCIHIKEISTFYVLDVMAYNNIDMVYCEAQCRFFWIKSKLEENPSLTEYSEYSKKRFLPLNFYDFNNPNEIKSCLLRYPAFDDEHVKLDGFLFYHKDAHYEYGKTPLVGWLFGFMIPEVLNFKVHEKYMNELPSDYVNYQDYIIKFDKNLVQKRKRYKNKKETKFDEVNDPIEDIMAMDILNSEQVLEMYGNKIDDPYIHDVDKID